MDTHRKKHTTTQTQLTGSTMDKTYKKQCQLPTVKQMGFNMTIKK